MDLHGTHTTGDGSPPATTLVVIAGSPLMPPVVGEYVCHDVQFDSSKVEDGEDLAHYQVGRAWSSQYTNFALMQIESGNRWSRGHRG
jgi:hypothetical protein